MIKKTALRFEAWAQERSDNFDYEFFVMPKFGLPHAQSYPRPKGFSEPLDT